MLRAKRTHHVIRRSHERVERDIQVSRPVVVSRSNVMTPRATRTALPVVNRQPVSLARPVTGWGGFQPDPYVDYGRALTAEGGILIAYKDLDMHLRHTLWRVFAWTVFTGAEGWFLFNASPVQSFWINLACFLIVALVNWLIVRKPVEIHRAVEIRPDCMILEGAEVFWRRFMEGGWPSFQPDKDGNQVLCGIYGTRFVEYLTLRRFDELDRAPEVFASHLQDAMRQMWAIAQI